MATSATLGLGQFITTLDGKRCTAVPRTDVSSQTISATSFQATPTAQTEAASQSNAQNAASSTTLQLGAGHSVTSADAQDAATATASAVAVSSSSNGGHSTRFNAAIVGGVVGGVMGIGLIALLIWFWRRQIKKRRRSTLLTPLSTEPWSGYGSREKRGFLLGQDSQGPTLRSAGIKSKVRAQYGRVRGDIGTRLRSGSVHSISSHKSGRSVDMNRGNSQYMNASPLISHGRSGSLALSGADESNTTIKDQITGVFSRIIGQSRTQESGFNEKNDIFSARGLHGSRNYTSPNSRQVLNAPDFLTLVNMDDAELASGAPQQRRHSRIRGGSEGSAMTKKSQQSSINPFSDIHAVPGPTGTQPSTYIQDMRRSRGQSLGAGSIDLSKVYDVRGLHIVNDTSNPAASREASRLSSDQVSNAPALSNFSGRESLVSDLSIAPTFAAKRNKFRSDPFDLEELSTSLPSNTGYPPLPFAAAAAVANAEASSNSGRLSRPQAAHTRHISDGSSKYTSGVADGVYDDWSDPGPDIGPIVR
ncbi:hypothetical protein BD289DRAFT_452104 [Coniella lustricola]|uniref:Uncharacterized protein n=1 Tax=Coniella lustricola TaxID=2025994 RepID=A0A2T3AC82_9PEZI|nr:hypothetical protein BD289DRAFT_452104 [Coniella lustricola]